MRNNTQRQEELINILIDKSINNKDARKAIIYSLIAVWFKHKNQDKAEFRDFVSNGSNKYINFELTINAYSVARDACENAATRAAIYATEYALDSASAVRARDAHKSERIAVYLYLM